MTAKRVRLSSTDDRLPTSFLVKPKAYSTLYRCVYAFFAGITAVSVAAHKGRQEIVKMLIAANADVNIDSNNGSTPLIQASHFGGSDVLTFLVRASGGCFVNSTLRR